MAQHVTLSNGAKLDIPDGTSHDDITKRVNGAEAMIKLHVPSYIGGAKGIWDALNNVAGTAGRVAGAGVDLLPAVGKIDWGIGGVNALKAILASKNPTLASLPDVPTISQGATALIGAPPMPENAPWWQRYGEAAVTGALSPQSRAANAARAVTGTVGGDVGGSAASHYLGPEWEKAGRWGASTLASAPDKAGDWARNFVSWLASGKQANEVADAGDQLNTRPSFGALATPTGRLIEKGLDAFPVVNMPSGQARERMSDSILAARKGAAEQVNQGPLPMSVDKGSAGSNLIQQARQRSAAIKAEGSRRFDELDQKVGAGTLVDARPIISAIQSAMRSPDLSADQIQGLQQRLDYLNSMTYGQPYYNGPVFGHNIAPVGSITLGQLSKFRSELGADLQNMPALDTVSQGRLRDTITQAVTPVYQRRGLGKEWDEANEFYKMNIGEGTVTQKLDAVGGTPVVGKPGTYSGGMDEQAAYNLLSRHTQSPSVIEPFVEPTSPYWRAAASQFIDTLGQPKGGQQGAEDFRTDTFGKDMRSITPEVLTQLAQAPNGGNLQPTVDNLRAAQVLGENSSVPVSRHGLTNSIASLAALSAVSGGIGHFFDHIGAPGGALAGPAALLAINYGLQSKPMTDAMSGRGGPSTPIVDSLYQNIPIAAATQNLNNPDDPRNQPVAPRPYSPLDQSRQ